MFAGWARSDIQDYKSRLETRTFALADLLCGSTVTWDGHLWKVVNLGETSVSLLSDDQRLTELPMHLLESLISQNRI